ncbi:MAG TPA: 30S ribosomal protein S6 [Firmicutes bacterium]|jgi:small subunit ribosomal protein S6|nr:30S ribosomal protein S6 [Bacillota bacterium]
MAVRDYEMMYIINPTVADQEETLEEAINKVHTLITDNGGEIVNVDRWGKRKLAYEINDISEGYYVVTKFKIAPSTQTEINRVLKLNENIVRYMIVNEELN